MTAKRASRAKAPAKPAAARSGAKPAARRAGRQAAPRRAASSTARRPGAGTASSASGGVQAKAARELLAAAARAGAAPLTVGLPKGRMAEECGLILAAALGVNPAATLAGTRRLAHDVPALGLRFFSLRGADVPAYVEHGAADLGIAGLDVLREEERELYEPLRLPAGRCRLVVAARPGAGPTQPGLPLKVATKYPRLAAEHFARAGVSVDIVPLHGSIEVAPALSLCDRIVDLSETGETLRANGLELVEEVLTSTATLVVNRVSLKLHPERVRAVIDALREASSR